jgi:hypothetical protein
VSASPASTPARTAPAELFSIHRVPSSSSAPPTLAHRVGVLHRRFSVVVSDLASDLVPHRFVHLVVAHLQHFLRLEIGLVYVHQFTIYRDRSQRKSLFSP